MYQELAAQLACEKSESCLRLIHENILTYLRLLGDEMTRDTKKSVFFSEKEVPLAQGDYSATRLLYFGNVLAVSECNREHKSLAVKENRKRYRVSSALGLLATRAQQWLSCALQIWAGEYVH